MAKKFSKPDYIATVAASLPRICPACANMPLLRTSESGGVLRLTCAPCAWTERYLVTNAV